MLEDNQFMKNTDAKQDTQKENITQDITVHCGTPMRNQNLQDSSQKTN